MKLILHSIISFLVRMFRSLAGALFVCFDFIVILICMFGLSVIELFGFIGTPLKTILTKKTKRIPKPL